VKGLVLCKKGHLSEICREEATPNKVTIVVAKFSNFVAFF
jgi:hypothetical protein